MKKKTNLLTLLIVIGLVLGVVYGQFILFDEAERIASDHWTKEAGDLILIRPLMLLIIPLIFTSVVTGITRIGDPSRLGLIGGATIFYYMATMLLAVVLGTAIVSTFQPGSGIDPETAIRLQDEGQARYETEQATKSRAEEAQGMGVGGAWMNIVRQVIPSNIVEEMSNGRPLGVIVFGILLGLAIAAGRETTKVAAQFFDALFEAMMILVQWVIWLTPIGVFFLTAWTVGRIGIAELWGPLGKYMILVIAGLAIHGFIVLPIVLFIFGRENPYKYIWKVRRALLTAFGTDSSSATLPVSIEVAEKEAGCSKRSANFVLPLGSTVNMDGTALYEAVAVVFLFQLFGIDLSFSNLVVVVVTATLAAVGAAGIPSAGLVTMVIVITAVNETLPANVAALPIAAIGVILGVDRILDMCRTTVNVWGDLVGAKIITRIAPDLEEAKEQAMA